MQGSLQFSTKQAFSMASLRQKALQEPKLFANKQVTL
jgi:hypothetical protein